MGNIGRVLRALRRPAETRVVREYRKRMSAEFDYEAEARTMGAVASFFDRHGASTGTQSSQAGASTITKSSQVGASTATATQSTQVGGASARVAARVAVPRPVLEPSPLISCW